MHKYFISAFVLMASVLQAQAVRTDVNGPIHEAFAQRVTEETALQAVPNLPPEPIQEQAPAHVDPLGIWIPGYWDWSYDTNNFIWISGIWRKPPPDKLWISGDWKDFDDGWARVRGFWNDVPEDEIAYINAAPPDQIDEDAGNPPDDNSFWLPGYWSYNDEQDDYEWLSGRWEGLDPNWVITPAHYVWRDEGYVFIPPYWDWPLDNRGQVYAATHFAAPIGSGRIFEPAIVLNVPAIINILFFDYPNYSCLFYHHYCYHRDFWGRYPFTPPWWGWRTWWTFSWHHCWGVWWWYGHPGYPAPTWFTPEVAASIPPPHADFVEKFKRFKGPLIITPHGVVAPSVYRNAIKETVGKGKALPVISVNVKNKAILDAALNKKMTEVKHYEPSGKKGAISPKAPAVKPAPQASNKPKMPAIKEQGRIAPAVKTPVKPVKAPQPKPLPAKVSPSHPPVHTQSQPITRVKESPARTQPALREEMKPSPVPEKPHERN